MGAVPTSKDRFTALDTLAVVREIRALGRPRIDKAFDDGSGTGWVLTLKSPGSGRHDLKLIPGCFAAVGPSAEDRPENLGPMARELRRLLSGGILSAVADPAGERYLEFEVLRGNAEEPTRLAVELFGTGNLVVAQGTRIVAVAHARSWAHRTVRIGAEYQRPPTRPDPFACGAAEIASALLASRTDRATTLAARLSMGGPLAEELLARTGLDGTVPAVDDAVQAAERLLPAMQGLLEEVGDRPRGFLYLRDGVAIDVEPFRAHRFAGGPEIREEEFSTFSEAADRYFRERRPAATLPDPSEARNAEIDRQITQQTEAVAKFEAEIGRLRSEAEAILAHYAEAEGALSGLLASGTVAEEGVTVRLGERTVHLEGGRSVRESAQARFDAMKEVQSKLHGAREALAQTAEARSTVTAARMRPGRGPASVRSRHFWFEPYRWFLSSEQAIVVGGRDASSNDRIVKRYLGAGDWYLHADLHGAPSIVVKHGAPGAPAVTEITLREAAQFGLAFSKAWRAGRASGDAYWVLPDQVSKGARAGEFVPKGGWMIQGTKHFFRDLPVELGIGEVRYESETLWSVAPPDSLRSRGVLRGLLTPGEERERPEIEVAVAGELGLPRSALQALLPAGGIRFRRA